MLHEAFKISAFLFQRQMLYPAELTPPIPADFEYGVYNSRRDGTKSVV